MTVQINYKTKLSNKKSSNLVLFVDEKFNISSLRKYISSLEYSFISDLIKVKNSKKQIIGFDVSSKKKIILVSLKKELTNNDAENLGANFFDKFKDTNQNQFDINSDTLPNQFKNIVGNFLHGIKLKSYKFEKYKTKKNKKVLSLFVFGKNIPSIKDQIKFNAIEQGTFFTRDLVSEPGNVLHPDEYAKRIKSLNKLGLKVSIYNEQKLKSLV